MRIIQLITRPQRRGAEIFAVQLAEQLILLGHEVWVISLLQGSGGLVFSKDFIQLDFDGKAKLDLIGFRKLAAVIKNVSPDIVQANAADTLRYAVGAMIFGSGDFKLIYRNANTISQFIKTKRQLLFNRLLHNKVDGVISVSDHSMRDYQKLFNPKRIISVPIGIDPLDIQAKFGKTTFEEKGYLLFVGSLVPEKDPIGMLEIFKEIHKVYPQIRLKYLGSGPLEKRLIEKINLENLKDSIELIPNQSNIFPILSNAKALVMPSKIEGLPGVILEAMYCTIPVVAYGVGGIPEVLKTNGTGWCVEPGNSKKFEEAIAEVLNASSQEIDKITHAAKEFVLKNYPMDKIASRFDSFYLQLMNQNTD